MLPLPFEKYVPTILKNNITVKGQALIDKVDTLLEVIKDEILEMYYFKDPVRTPNSFLEELGFWLNANLLNTDSDFNKRSKVKGAVRGHKNRGSWEDDAKIRIDSITSLDSAIFRAVDTDDWILGGDGIVIDSSYYWATMGADGLDLDLGLALIGAGDEVEVAGNIYIDLHEGVFTAVLTVDQITQIVTEIEDDVVPGYFRVHLGYINTTGQFIVYSGGVIG